MLERLRRRRARAPEPPAERAHRIRERLAALDLERLELLADEWVPGRKHRLDAVAAASRDLQAELDDLEPGSRDRLSRRSRCRTATGPR